MPEIGYKSKSKIQSRETVYLGKKEAVPGDKKRKQMDDPEQGKSWFGVENRPKTSLYKGNLTHHSLFG